MAYILTVTTDLPIDILKGSPLYGIYQRAGIETIRELMVEDYAIIDGIVDVIRKTVQSRPMDKVREYVFVSSVIDDEGNGGPTIETHRITAPEEVKA